MWRAFVFMADNLGMTLGVIILIVFNLAWMIFMAKDVRLGLIMWVLTDACLFMAYYGLGWPYEYPLVLMFMGIVGLALSLFFVGGVTNNGGGYT